MTSPTNSGMRRLALTAAVVAGAFLAGALAVGVISTATAQPGTTTTPGNGYGQGDPGTRTSRNLNAPTSSCSPATTPTRRRPPP